MFCVIACMVFRLSWPHRMVRLVLGYGLLQGVEQPSKWLPNLGDQSI
jgi:hypothetical protein